MELDTFTTGFIVGILSAGGLFMGAWALAKVQDLRRRLEVPPPPERSHDPNDHSG